MRGREVDLGRSMTVHGYTGSLGQPDGVDVGTGQAVADNHDRFFRSGKQADNLVNSGWIGRGVCCHFGRWGDIDVGNIIERVGAHSDENRPGW